ncbi:hypothetical protein LJB88_02430 [Erysipelotrichaceae bacterium OttesenSCG-928-M19]|nr:hypothetical protein [Erysipelotrichaceae bacterium OttesenSCG-928-M19]
MIIWSGKGFLILIFFMLCFGIVYGLTDLVGITISDAKVTALSMFMCAIINYFFVSWLASRPKKLYIDAETNEEFYFEDNDSLFFIPLKYWTYILLVISIFSFFIYV